MARKRQKDDLARPISQLVALVFGVCWFIPGIRHSLASAGFIFALILFVCLAGVIAFVIYRLATPERRMHPIVPAVSVARATPVPALAPALVTPRPVANPIPVAAIPPKPPVPLSLLHQLHALDWFQFEKVVGQIYRELGYSVARRGGANPDGGIDMVIRRDGQSVAVQCKQWKAWKVGVKAIREFLGALTDSGLPKGIFITLVGYTDEARQLAEKHGIEIVDGLKLARMLESTGAQSGQRMQELLQDTRKFCPKCENPMVLRVTAKGENIGNKFWGCSTFPRCRYVLPVV